jgi:Dolichyl-phosphate-mannose-protein mannosyltransferase
MAIEIAKISLQPHKIHKIAAQASYFTMETIHKVNGFKKIELKQFDWLLTVILVAGFVVRIWGISFGLPHRESRPDETIIVTQALGFFSGDLNPHSFSYGSFYKYILFILYIFYFLIGKGTGKYSEISDLLSEFARDPTGFYLIDRCASALLGTATCFVLYKLGERLFDRKTALVASLFLSLSYLHVRDSHFGTVDIPLTFFVMTALLFIVKSYEDKTTKSYLISGILGGLATSIKYNGLIVIVPMLVVHFFNVLDERTENNTSEEAQFKARRFAKILQYLLLALAALLLLSGLLLTPEILLKRFQFANPTAAVLLIQQGRKALALGGFGLVTLALMMPRVKFLSDFLDRRFASFICLFTFAFVLGTPFGILDVKLFIQDFLYAARELQNGHGLILGIGWWYHLRYSLPLGLGVCLFCAALVGCLTMTKSSFRKAAILLSFPLVYYIAIGKGYNVFLRFIIPIIPFACLTAAVLLTQVITIINQYFKSRFSERFATAFLAALIIFQSCYNIIIFDSILAKRDNRLIATDWVYSHAKENSTFYQTGYNPGQLELDKSPRTISEKVLLVGGARLSLAQSNSLSSKNVKTYQEWTYDEELNEFSYNKQNQSELPDYIIKQEYPLPLNTGISDKIVELLGDFYSLETSFVAYNIRNSENWFDKLDAFYIPFAGFKEVQRPGPNIYIYAKK